MIRVNIDELTIFIIQIFLTVLDDNHMPNNHISKLHTSCSEDEQGNVENSTLSPVSSSDSTSMVQSMASVAAAAAASRQWYSNKADMIPFLSLCSRYPGGPWAGLLQQTMKEKQKGRTIRLGRNRSNILKIIIN